MSDTKHIQVTLQITGDLDDGGRSPSGGILISISSDGINWKEAGDELRSKLVTWAVSFLKYAGTDEVLIRPQE